MKNRAARKILSAILAISIAITSLSVTIFADGMAWDPNAGGGGNTGNVGGGSFHTYQQGFRVTILEGANPMYPEYSCVDMLFSKIPDNVLEIGRKNRLENAEAGYIDNKFLGTQDYPDLSDMPYPILWDESSRSFIANGQNVRKYLMDGEGYNPFGNQAPSGGSGSSGGNGGGSGNIGGATGDPNDPLTDYQKYACDTLIRLYSEKISKYMAPMTTDLDAMRQFLENGYSGAMPFVPHPDVVSSNLQAIYNEGMARIKNFTGVTNNMIREVDLVLGQYVSMASSNYRKLYEQVKNQSIKPLSTQGNYSIELMNNTYNIKDIEIPLAESIPNNVGDGSGKNAKMLPFLQACFLQYHPTIIEDIENAKNPILLIETVVWFQPITTSNVTAPYFLYGTAPNIAEHNIQYASVYGNDHGAYMQRLTNEALPLSMVTEKDDPLLKILQPNTSIRFIPSQDLIAK